jgi:hypothetical protein
MWYADGFMKSCLVLIFNKDRKVAEPLSQKDLNPAQSTETSVQIPKSNKIHNKRRRATTATKNIHSSFLHGKVEIQIPQKVCGKIVVEEDYKMRICIIELRGWHIG